MTRSTGASRQTLEHKLVEVHVTQARTAAEQLWYKDAIIYQLHVKSFFDSNNDGIGDFPGLISKLDYIADPRGERYMGAAVLSLAAA